MLEDYIRYDRLIDEAMRGVIRKALMSVERDGLQGEHHFLVTFMPKAKGVKIAPWLVAKHPYEMTVVIHRQYEDLKVSHDKFEISLNFNKKKEKLIIPFASIMAFADPYVRFGLRFNVSQEEAIVNQRTQDNYQESIKKTVSSSSKITVKEDLVEKSQPAKKSVGKKTTRAGAVTDDGEGATKASGRTKSIAGKKKDKYDNLIFLDQFRSE